MALVPSAQKWLDDWNQYGVNDSAWVGRNYPLVKSGIITEWLAAVKDAIQSQGYTPIIAESGQAGEPLVRIAEFPDYEGNAGGYQALTRDPNDWVANLIGTGSRVQAGTEQGSGPSWKSIPISSPADEGKLYKDITTPGRTWPNYWEYGTGVPMTMPAVAGAQGGNAGAASLRSALTAQATPATLGTVAGVQPVAKGNALTSHPLFGRLLNSYKELLDFYKQNYKPATTPVNAAMPATFNVAATATPTASAMSAQAQDPFARYQGYSSGVRYR